MVCAKRASNCSIIEKNPPKGVSFSDFICIFAMSFRVLFVIKCSTKISENSDIKKSRATYCFSGTYFKKQNLTTDGNQSKKIKMVAAVTTAAFAWHIS
jgi:hypothetical protein